MNNNTELLKSKVCNKCQRDLPLDSDHFRKSKKSKNGFRGECKECYGYKFTKNKNPRKGYKICTKCYEEKPLNFEFWHKNKGMKDGFETSCKECRAKYNLSVREERNLKGKDYYLKNRKRILEKQKDYREDNRERKNKYFKEYRKNYPDRERQTKRKYYLKNKEKFNKRTLKRQAQKRNLEYNLTNEQWVECKEYFSNKCAYCGEKKKLDMEHFIPLTKNGEFTKNNILPACRSCNSSKNNRDFFQWYPKQKYYSKKREQEILKYLNYNKNKEQQLALL